MPNCALYSQRHIARIVMTKETSIEVQFVDVQIQSGVSVFALAFATSLCSGDDPAELNYSQHEFRGQGGQENHPVSNKTKEEDCQDSWLQ